MQRAVVRAESARGKLRRSPVRPLCCLERAAWTWAVGLASTAARRRRWLWPRHSRRVTNLAKFGLSLGVALLCGCAAPKFPRHAVWLAQQPGAATALDFQEQCICALSQDLQSLAPTVSPAEARALARAAIEGAAALRREYAPVRPAWVNNMLVNLGIKPRGLCYHWADDLGARLLGLELRTLRLYRAVMRQGRLREHSGLVVTAQDQPFEQGVLLDAWRYGGRLFWDFLQHLNEPWVLVGEEQQVQARNRASTQTR